MSAYQALILYEDTLRGFQNHLSDGEGDRVTALESGFGYLRSRLRIHSAALYWWNDRKKSLVLQYEFREGTIMEGEEEMRIQPQTPLWALVQEQVPVVISPRKPWVAYMPLCQNNQLIGAVRLERHHRLPNGRVLENLPRFHSKAPRSKKDFPFLDDVADILSFKLQDINRDTNHKKQTQYLKAGSEVAAAVVETPRLKEMLEAVSKSIVVNLGFDRIRFYLVDQGHSELKGILGLQIPTSLLNMENEKYPLKPYINSLVDAVLDGKNNVKFVSAGGKVVYVPLIVGGQIIGCMAVDNLLSQIVIQEEQIATLRSLAGQIGMAVLNARLFEDIEQQAITDGLTKLYVYRYFQQRLKEEIDRADRYSYSVALVMMDVDNFKNFNDTYGHAVGDKVLEFLAQSIRSNIRRIDLAARYGGDEFILLLPEITEQEAWLMGSRLLNAVKESKVTSNEGEILKVNVTIGVSMYPNDSRNGRDLMESADKALYWAKKNNRGDICFYRNISNKVERTA